MTDKLREALEREQFEAFHGRRRNKGRARAERMFDRLPDDTYADESVQRHWWTWQNAIRAALAAPVVEAGAPTTVDLNLWKHRFLPQGTEQPSSLHWDEPERRDVSPQAVNVWAYGGHAQRISKLAGDYAEAWHLYADERSNSLETIRKKNEAHEALLCAIAEALGARPPAVEAEPVEWPSYTELLDKMSELDPNWNTAGTTRGAAVALASRALQAIMAAALLQQPQEGWVSVEERLPEVSDWYLVTIADPQDIGWETKRPWMAWFEAGEWLNCDPISDGQPVTHWRPALTAAAPSQGEGEG